LVKALSTLVILDALSVLSDFSSVCLEICKSFGQKLVTVLAKLSLFIIEKLDVFEILKLWNNCHQPIVIGLKGFLVDHSEVD
jgi:hypothetical protein